MSTSNVSKKQPGVNGKRSAQSQLQTAVPPAKTPQPTPYDDLESQLRARTAEVTQLQEALRLEIAAHQQTKEKLRDTEMQFRAIAHSANDAIIAADAQGQITFWNKGAQNIFGYAEEEMVGQPLTNLMPDRYRAAHQNGLERFKASGKANLIGKTVEFEGLRKNEREFPLELSLSTWMTGDGPFFSGIIRDVTNRKEAEKLLAEQDNLLQTLIDVLPDYVYIKDTHNGQVINNMAHVGMWGPNGTNGNNGNNGKVDADHSIRDLAAQYYAHEQEVIRTGQPLLDKEEVVLDPHGRKHWLLTTTVPLRNEQGEITALVGVSRDITERRRAEEERDRLFSLSSDLLVVAGLDGYLKQVNPAWEKTLGYSKAGLLAKPFIELVHPADRDTVRKELQRLAAGANTVSLEILLICADGTYCWTSWNVTPFVSDGLVFGVGRDITKRKQAEKETIKLFEAVSQQRAELRALTNRLAEVQETERQQLGRELHDQIGQNLSALGFNLNFIQTQMPASLTKATLIRTRLNDSLTLVEQTTERIRDVLAELRPPMLDDYGLVEALHWYADRVGARFGLSITVQAENLTTRLAPTIENALFRITQEALTNVAKHAQATRVMLSLAVEKQTIRLLISDNGHGFEASGINGSAKRQGWGLQLMGERAEMIGGRCRVESQARQGTQVIVEVGP